LKTNVIEAVVQNGFCIGCGICAGLCPANLLKMDFNKYGEYNPFRSRGCLDKCNLCLQVCPFYNQVENEDSLAITTLGHIDGIKHRKETGYYITSYVAYSNVNNHRANGASGGMATWILETLLAKNKVDQIICVTPNNDAERLFRFAILADVESIRHSAKSAYYPVEMSSIIKEIINREGRYVIVGLPCFLKGLRFAQKKNKRLRERIAFTVGLVCGQMKSKHYTTYIASLAGINSKLKKVDYRGKSPQKPAGNFFFYCLDENNNEGKLFWKDGVSEVWTYRWFTPNACNFCDDIFAEVSDVTVMDAWLPEYSKDSRGTNFIISRSPQISDLLRQGGVEKKINIKDIAIEKIIEAQHGVVNIKRNQLAYRLYLAKQHGSFVPSKRVYPSRKVSFASKKEIEIKDAMQAVSKELFLKNYDREKVDLNSFSKSMNIFVNDLHKWNRISHILLRPVNAIRKARQILLSE
jgi:coenzyme F420-reducing hydrogenase beta subunit